MASDSLTLNGFNDPIDISILLAQSTNYPGKYYLILDGNFEGYLAITDSKTLKECKYLWQSAETLLTAAVEKRSTYKDLVDLLQDPAQSLAYRGHLVINRIFGEGELRDKLMTRIEEEIEKGEAPIVEVQSDKLDIPWDWLYLEPHPPAKRPRGAVDDDTFKDILLTMMKPFWGFSMIISRLPHHEKTPAGPYGQELQPTNGLTPNVNLLVDHDVPFANQECNVLEQIADLKQITINAFELAEQYESKPEFIKHINEFLSQESDILHLICHATHTDDELSIPYIQLGEHRYQADFVDIDPAAKPKASIIFFNACSMGLLCTGDPLNFTRSFWEKGDAEIIAADAQIGSEMASRFTGFLYKYLIEDGYSLGEAFFHSRMEMIHQSQMPGDYSSLFYGLYGHATHRLI